MSEADSGEKTFEATDQRREDFRKKGRYARSKDAAGIAALGVLTLGLLASRRQLSAATEVLFTRTLGDLGALDRMGAFAALRSAAAPIAAEIAPILGGAVTVAMLLGAAQVGFRLNTEAVKVDFDRIHPKHGLEKLVALKKNTAELGISLARVSAVGAVAWTAVTRELPVLLTIAQAPLVASMEAAVAAVGHIVFAILGALVVVAGADYAYAWFSLQAEMRMTRQERMDESKREEGDVKAKGRMKARARAHLKKFSIEGVKAADVIVTNPTHVAVALRYGTRDVAPVVVAKGLDEVALRIRSIARKHGIPILENRPLARALHAEVAVGRPVPQAHFAAVAHVLAFVYRLEKRGALDERAGGERGPSRAGTRRASSSQR